MRARPLYAPQPGQSARGRVHCAHSSFVWRRSLFEEDRLGFSVSLRILEPSVGRLGRRVVGTASARAISSSSRALAFGSVGFLCAVLTGRDDQCPVLRGAIAG
jgi:hypothetical protein